MLIEVTIEGITALILDKFTNELLDKGPKTTNNGHEDTPQDQAERRLYVDQKGTPIFPADNLLSCIIDAGRFIKVGKRQLSTRDTTIVTSFLSIVEPWMVIKSSAGWRVDARGVVNQATKGRHVAYRPIFDQWGFTFTLDVDVKECRPDTAREIIDRAGRAIGIGVMRPARKGRYGQFKVIKWAEKKVKLVTEKVG
jgi:hypothetical protein